MGAHRRYPSPRGVETGAVVPAGKVFAVVDGCAEADLPATTPDAETQRQLAALLTSLLATDPVRPPRRMPGGRYRGVVITDALRVTFFPQGGPADPAAVTVHAFHGLLTVRSSPGGPLFVRDPRRVIERRCLNALAAGGHLLDVPRAARWFHR